MRKWLKYLLFLAGGLLAAVILLAAFTRTPFFKSWLRDMAVSRANQALAGEVRIDRIGGNLFDHLEISGILLTNEEDTVLYLPRLALRFRPASLLRKEIWIDSLALDSLFLKLRQYPDSSWNVAKLLPPDSGAAVDTTEAPAPFDWKITVNDFRLKNAGLRIIPLDSAGIIPSRVENINADLEFAYSEEAQKLHLREFRFHARNPDFRLAELSFRVGRTAQEITFKDLALRTGSNRLEASGRIDPSGERLSGVNLAAAPLQFSEFQFLLPEIRLAAAPSLSLKAAYRADSLHIDLALRDREQAALLKGFIAGLEGEPRYRLNCELRGLDLAGWVKEPALNYVLNGSIQLNGEGVRPETARAAVQAELQNCRFESWPVEQLRLTAEYSAGNVRGNASIHSEAGSAEVDARVDDIRGEQRFQINAGASRLNLAKLFHEDSLETDLHLALAAEGAGFDPQTLDGSLRLEIDSSYVIGQPLQRAFASLRIQGGNYHIDALEARLPAAALQASGYLNLPDSLVDLEYYLEAGDLSALRRFIPADTLKLQGFLQGQVQGRPDSLATESTFQFHRVAYNNVGIDSLSGALSALLQKENLRGELSLRAGNAGMPGLRANKIDLRADFAGDSLNIFADIFQHDSLGSQITARLALDSFRTRVYLPQIDLNLNNWHWNGGNDSTWIDIDSTGIEIHRFLLAHREQYLRAEGRISFAGAEAFEVDIHGLEYARFLPLAGVNWPLGGRLNFGLNITGDAGAPAINGRLSITNGSLFDLPYEKFHGEFAYRGDRLSWESGLLLSPGRELLFTGRLPVSLSFAGESEGLDWNKPMFMELKTDQFDLAGLRFYKDNRPENQLSGSLACNLKLENTLNDPAAGGFVEFYDLSLNLPRWGINYPEAQLKLEVGPEKLSISTFQVKGKSGSLSLSGGMEFDSSIVKGNLKQVDIKLAAKNFLAAQSRDYEIVLNGDAELSGKPENLRYRGDISVPRARFYLPALMKNYDAAAVPEKLPLLVEAARAADSTRDASAQPDLTQQREPKPGAQTTRPEYYQNLRGTLHLSIPRDTWLETKELKVEIAGELDVVKEGEYFEIFGPVQTVRGWYDLLGKRFEIREGVVTFTGGKEFNPEVAVWTRHIFRDAEREKRTLELQISDKAFSPKLQFTLDDQQIEEADALSYLFFGRGVNELSSGQKSEMAGQEKYLDASAMATGMAVSLLAGQLTQGLENSLKVDYLEIKGEDNWQSGRFVVGKYLTSDVFVSYEKGFGRAYSDQSGPDLVTLEYNITKFLYLQLSQAQENSGFEVIFKFEK